MGQLFQFETDPGILHASALMRRRQRCAMGLGPFKDGQWAARIEPISSKAVFRDVVMDDVRTDLRASPTDKARRCDSGYQRLEAAEEDRQVPGTARRW